MTELSTEVNHSNVLILIVTVLNNIKQHKTMKIII